ncbi:hypothetical protein C8T65DRAFT_693996 [Cerioporus squamosus]|nr:hypothetical protein C8T65DRAFT_693996 [Cerioporus squamosus]
MHNDESDQGTYCMGRNKGSRKGALSIVTTGDTSLPACIHVDRGFHEELKFCRSSVPPVSMFVTAARHTSVIDIPTSRTTSKNPSFPKCNEDEREASDVCCWRQADTVRSTADTNSRRLQFNQPRNNLRANGDACPSQVALVPAANSAPSTQPTRRDITTCPHGPGGTHAPTAWHNTQTRTITPGIPKAKLKACAPSPAYELPSSLCSFEAPAGMGCAAACTPRAQGPWGRSVRRSHCADSVTDIGARSWEEEPQGARGIWGWERGRGGPVPVEARGAAWGAAWVCLSGPLPSARRLRASKPSLQGAYGALVPGAPSRVCPRSTVPGGWASGTSTEAEARKLERTSFQSPRLLPGPRSRVPVATAIRGCWRCHAASPVMRRPRMQCCPSCRSSPYGASHSASGDVRGRTYWLPPPSLLVLPPPSTVRSTVDSDAVASKQPSEAPSSCYRLGAQLGARRPQGTLKLKLGRPRERVLAGTQNCDVTLPLTAFASPSIRATASATAVDLVVDDVRGGTGNSRPAIWRIVLVRGEHLRCVPRGAGGCPVPRPGKQEE